MSCRVIATQESRTRIERLAALARREHLDGVVLSADSNIDYFSGYRHHAPWTLFARPFFEVIDADGRAAMIAHSFLVPEIERTSAVPDIRAYARSGCAALAPLVECIHDFGIASGRIGAELGYEQRLGLSLNDYRALQRALPGATFADAASIIWRLRMIKSPAEQALMRRSAAITGEAFAACFDAARAGMTEQAIAQVAGETMMRHGADRPGFILISSGPESYHCLSGKPTERRLMRDDMLWMDMGSVYRGYWSDFCRAGIVGEPSRTQRDAQRAILEVNRACVEAVRVGEPLSRVAESAESAFARLDISVRIGDGRIGHGMGLMSTEPPHTALYEDTLMADGLVFTIEPRFITDEGIFNCEELVLVTPHGAELLTDTPRDLTAIG